MASEDFEYVGELAEYSDEQFEDLSDAFWKRLSFAKDLDEELRSVGIEITVRPAIEEKEYDIRLSAGADDTGDDFDIIDHPDVPTISKYEWEEMPAVLNHVTSVGGEVVSVIGASHSERDEAELTVEVSFPRLA